jgi:hypothetical protein
MRFAHGGPDAKPRRFSTVGPPIVLIVDQYDGVAMASGVSVDS